MISNLSRLLFSVIVATAPALVFAAAAKSDFPDRPIRLIVPFPPGGGTDTVSRTMQPALQQALGQQLIIDNRGSAQGITGTGIAASAVPDGYTLVIAEIGATALAPAMTPNVNFDVVKDFAPITKLIEQPYILSVHPSVPAKSLAEFIKLAQAKAGALNYGSGNVTAHVMQEVFYRTAKLTLTHIPYKGSGPSVTALVAGEVQALFSGPGAALPMIKAGRIRPLAVTTLKRARELPDLPTLNESGFKGFEVSGWYGVMAPAKTPRPVIERLQREIVAVVQQPDTVKRFAADGAEAVATSPREFAAHIAAENGKWARVIKEAGIKGE